MQLPYRYGIGYVRISRALIRGEPEYTRNQKWCIIYLCVILHGNDLMHMLKHHVYDENGKGRQYHRLSELAIARLRTSSYVIGLGRS